jgi:hypothetical protein
MVKRNRRTQRAMRDVFELRIILEVIVRAGGAEAAAASHLLEWAAVQQHSADGDAGAVADALADADDSHCTLQQRHQQQTQQQQQQQQQQQVGSSSSSGPAEQPQLLSTAGPDEWERWSFARRSGAVHKNQCGAGNAAGTREALLRWSTLSVVCSRPGCCALVDYKVARRQAKQAGRVHFEHGDDCAGPEPCSSSHKPSRFARRQQKHADQLEAGERLLVRWPGNLTDREIWYYSDVAAREAAAAARAAL